MQRHEKKIYPLNERVAVCQESDWLFVTHPQTTKSMDYLHTLVFSVQYCLMRDFCTVHCWLQKADVCCY